MTKSQQAKLAKALAAIDGGATIETFEEGKNLFVNVCRKGVKYALSISNRGVVSLSFEESDFLAERDQIYIKAIFPCINF